MRLYYSAVGSETMKDHKGDRIEDLGGKDQRNPDCWLSFIRYKDYFVE